MAPTAAHESRLTDAIPYIHSLLSGLSYASRKEKVERRAQSGSMPSSQVAGFAVAIAILSAIIIGECR